MIRAIIFDLNGVIIESTDVNAQIYARIFSQFDEEVVKKVTEHYKNFGGIPRQKRIEMYLREFAGIEPTQEMIEQMSKQFSYLYLESLKKAQFVPGALHFLENNYKNYLLFLSTGAPQKELPQMLEILNLTKYFIKAYGAPKNKAQHIAEILAEFSLKPEETVFIGDSPKDKEAADKNQIYFIARDRGLKAFENEPFKIKDLTQLDKIIKKLNQISF